MSKVPCRLCEKTRKHLPAVIRQRLEAVEARMRAARTVRGPSYQIDFAPKK
jgi:hypothetical protein